eukprot:1386238-Amphidinium_carterae.1
MSTQCTAQEKLEPSTLFTDAKLWHFRKLTFPDSRRPILHERRMVLDAVTLARPRGKCSATLIYKEPCTCNLDAAVKLLCCTAIQGTATDAHTYTMNESHDAHEVALERGFQEFECCQLQHDLCSCILHLAYELFLDWEVSMNVSR